MRWRFSAGPLHFVLTAPSAVRPREATHRVRPDRLLPYLRSWAREHERDFIQIYREFCDDHAFRAEPPAPEDLTRLVLPAIARALDRGRIAVLKRDWSLLPNVAQTPPTELRPPHAAATPSQLHPKPTSTDGPPVVLAPPFPTELAAIELHVVDELGEPVEGVHYRIRCSDGSTREGTSDVTGLIREEGVSPGPGTVSLLDVAPAEWSMTA